jgi:phosphatidylglycerophosphate synthase
VTRPMPAALIIGDPSTRLWGITSPARLRRSLARAGVTQFVTSAAEKPAGVPLLILKAIWVFDDVLIQRLTQSPDVVLISSMGDAVAAHVTGDNLVSIEHLLEQGICPDEGMGLRVVDVPALIGSYNDALRKREQPFLLPLLEAELPAIERRMFGASYKGVTDLVTKYLWPVPARHVTKLCAVLGITPNQVTFASFVFVCISFACFWQGAYWSGMLSAIAMTFLDTVDGKLARVTLTSSKIGNIFDHGIDLVHPPFWWWAWVMGLVHVGFALSPAMETFVLGSILGGYVVQRVIEGIFMRLYGMHIHVWRPFDSFFRLITARRNPNLILLLLSLLMGRPDLGIIAVAVWTLLSLLVHAGQLLQAMLAQAKPVSWLSR